MLINFEVSNYRSFRDNTEFSMETGKYLKSFKDSHVISSKHRNVLKSAVVFGGNANGKTNLLFAISFLRWILMNPTQTEDHLLRTETFSYNKENTSFAICFIKNNKEYRYQLEYNEREVVKENLSINSIVFFDRYYQEFHVLPDSLQNLKNNIRKNTLLFFFAQSNNTPEAMEAYSWFRNDIIEVDTDEVDNKIFEELEDQKFKERFLCFLRAADFNIVNVEVKKKILPVPSEIKKLFKDMDNDLFNSNVVYEIYSTHKSRDGEFEVHFRNESRGTKIFMFLAVYILKNKLDGKVLLIDEFDQSFHQELAEALLDLFNNPKQNNQFILTTHELGLMNYNLRPDQIWFAEKNEFGETDLFSIFDFDDPSLTRLDYGYKKRYLQGRYGAKQLININKLTDALGEL